MGITKEQIEISAKDRTKEALQQAEKGFISLDKSIATALKGAAALAGVTGLGAVIKSSLETADAIAKTAKAAGVGTTFLQEMRFAAEQSGVATNMLDDGMRRLTRRIGLAADGGGPAIKAFEKMNIAVHDVSGNVRSTENIFKDLTSGLGNVKSTAEQAALASAFFGDDAGPKLALLLQEGEAGIDSLREKAQELGLVLSEEMVRGAEKAGDKISQLEQILSIKMVKTVADNAEVIGDLAEAMIDLVGAAAKGGKALTDFGTTLGKSVSDYFHPVTTSMDLINDKIAKTKEAIEKANGVINDDGFLGFGASTEAEIIGAKAKLEELNITLQKQLKVRQLIATETSTSIVSTVTPTLDKDTNPNNIFAQPTNSDVLADDAAAQKDAARREAQIQAIELQYASEEERLSTTLIKREAMVEQAFQDGYIEEERRNAIIQDLEQSHNDELRRIQEDSLSAQAKLWQTNFQGRLKVVSGVLGQVSNLMQTENKKQFEIGKKAAIVQTAINTYQAAMGAYSALAPIPIVGPVLGAAAAAAALLYGKSQISQIKGQQFGGGGGGGGAGSAPTGTFPANPNTGAPTGSPAGGSTNIEEVTPTGVAANEPNRVVNITYVSSDQQEREKTRDLVGLIDKAVGDGVDINLDLA